MSYKGTVLEICNHPLQTTVCFYDSLFFLVVGIDGLVCDYFLALISEGKFQRLGDFFRVCRASDYFFPFSFFISSVKN